MFLSIFHPHTVIAGYEKSIQHTYIPMSVLAVTYSIVIISIPLLYKWMAPQATKTKPLRLGAFYSLPSLNEFNTEQGATLYTCNTYIDYRLNWMVSVLARLGISACATVAIGCWTSEGGFCASWWT